MAPASATPPRALGAGPTARLSGPTAYRSRGAARRTGAPAGRLAVLLAALAGLAGCLCPASDAALLDVGFRSPEQAFRTFQTAVRADEAELEFRCLSGDFRRRFDPPISRLTYLEARDVMQRENRWLRTGIAKARIDTVERFQPARGPRRARIRASSFGVEMEIELVQEDFAELWAEGEPQPVLEREIPFEQWVGVVDEGSGAWVTGGVPLPAGVVEADVTELRLGREWKIDGWRQVEDDEEPRP